MVEIKAFASALLELAAEKDVISQTREQLQETARVWKDNPDLVLYLKHPKVLKKEKQELLDQILADRDTLMARFIKVLNQHDAAAYLEPIAEEFDRQMDELENRESVYVESAMPLDEAQQQALKEVLSKKMKKNIHLELHVDPKLIGGLRVKTKEFTLDNTVWTRAEKMKETLKKNS
ncbi:MAG: ATP synthase F1 subunit delta [Erysipelotrichaceae bacterium]|nr:ATP synthase F1 subunit delta [Erysipelotrichaceae bacterium]